MRLIHLFVLSLVIVMSVALASVYVASAIGTKQTPHIVEYHWQSDNTWYNLDVVKVPGGHCALVGYYDGEKGQLSCYSGNKHD